MEKRRHFLKTIFTFFTGIGVLLSPFFQAVRMVYAKAQKIILPKDTDRKKLINKDPAQLDTRNLAPTPLKDFETMGDTEQEVNLEQWRLQITGKVKNPFKLTYSQILELPPIERKVLMICPGFFSNHGLWKGISIWNLLETAGMSEGVTHVTLRGAASYTEKVDRFELEEVRSNKVFLAYQVNGEVLPQKHGYPLRAVATDQHGDSWTKYVHTVEADIVK